MSMIPKAVRPVLLFAAKRENLGHGSGDVFFRSPGVLRIITFSVISSIMILLIYLALCFIGSLALLVLLIVQRIVDLIRASAGAIDVQINVVVSWRSDRRERKPGPRKHYGLILAIAPQNRHDVRCVAVPRKDVLELVEVLSGILKGSNRHAFNLDREWLPRVLPSLTRIRPGQRYLILAITGAGAVKREAA